MGNVTMFLAAVGATSLAIYFMMARASRGVRRDRASGAASSDLASYGSGGDSWNLKWFSSSGSGTDANESCSGDRFDGGSSGGDCGGGDGGGGSSGD